MNRNALGTIMWTANGVMMGALATRLSDPMIAYSIGAIALLITLGLTAWLGRKH